MEPRILHEEARPLPHSQLVADQARGIDRAVKLLAEMAIEVADADRLRNEASGAAAPLVSLLGIEEQRSSRAVLIDGERGTGKTAMLVTLIKLLAQGAFGVANDWFCKSGSVRDAIDSLAQTARIVPTPIIDLQPLPDNTHLLLHVASQLRRLVELVDPDRHDSPARPLDAPASAQDFDAFAQKAGKAWGLANDRRSQLSPDELALELSDVERDRSELNKAFRKFIDSLVHDLSVWLERREHSSKKQLLLIVPIDDADLNPWRSTELLELVRWLYHPRVIFLMAGDADNFRRDLRARAYGAGMASVKHLQMSSPDWLYDRRTVSRLATDAFDKAIPPAHRLRLPRIEPAEFWTRAPALKTALATIGSGEDTLLATIERLHLKLALPTTLRALLQLAPRLQELAAAPAARPADSVLRASEYLLRHAMTRAGDLHSLSMRTQADESFLPGTDDVDRATQELVFSLSNTLLVRRTGDSETPPTGIHILPLDTRLIARVRRTASDASVNVPSTMQDEYLSPVPEGLAHAAMLYHEVRSYIEGVSNDATPHSSLLYGVTEHMGLRHREPWPVLPARHFRDVYDNLNELHGHHGPSGSEESLFLSFLSLLVPALRVRGQRPPSVEVAAARLRASWAPYGVASEAVRLAAPEFGLSADLARRWLDALRACFGPRWSTVVSYVADKPHTQLPPARAGAPTDHPWFDDFGDDTRRPGRIAAKAIAEGRLSPSELCRMSPTQAETLSRLTGVSADVVNETMEQAREFSNSYETFLVRLWSAVEGSDAKTFDKLGFSIRDAEDGIEVLPERHPEIRGMDAPHALGKHRAYRVGEFRNDAEARLAEFGLALPLRTLHDLALDLARDERSSKGGKRPVASWPGIMIGDICPWPWPAYRTFTDTALLCDVWNHAISDMERLNVHPQQAIEALAMTFVRSIDQVASNQRPNIRPYPGRVRVSDWQQAADLIAVRRRECQGSARFERHKGFLHWASIWRVMASPEGGLSRSAAEAILSTMAREDASQLALARSQLVGRAARKAAKDHPWFEYVEQRK